MCIYRKRAMNNLIKADGIVKKFGMVEALKGVNLEVSEGSITGLIGPDGAGKSTMMKIALSLLKRDKGILSVLSADPDENKATIRQHTGYMPETFSLYTDLTVEENLKFYSRIHKIDRSLYSEKRERLYRFSRLESFSETRAGNLSGGMKQKLALSCALMNDPDLLVLDEPTTGVDPLSRQEFWNMLHELQSRGITILVSTPYMDEALKCNYIYMMHRGKIVEKGLPASLIKDFSKSLFEFEVPGKRPQEYIDLLKEIFSEEAVFMSGKKVHAVMSGTPTLVEVKTRTTALDVSFRIKKILPELEDLFISRILSEDSNETSR